MKTLILISAFCFVTIINSYSQTKQESIKELFHLMKQDSIMDKTFSSMLPSMISQFQGPVKDSASAARSKELMNSSIETMKVIMKKLIDEDMVIIYDKYFSQNEINDFISFYRSPSGQKFINVTPDISKDVMMIMMQKYVPEMKNSMKAKMEELKK